MPTNPLFVFISPFELFDSDGKKLDIDLPKGAMVRIKVYNDRAKASKISIMAFKNIDWLREEMKIRGVYAPTKANVSVQDHRLGVKFESEII